MTIADHFTIEELQIIADLRILYDGILMLKVAYPGHGIIPQFEVLYKRMVQKYQPLLQAYSEVQRGDQK